MCGCFWLCGASCLCVCCWRCADSVERVEFITIVSVGALRFAIPGDLRERVALSLQHGRLASPKSGSIIERSRPECLKAARRIADTASFAEHLDRVRAEQLTGRLRFAGRFPYFSLCLHPLQVLLATSNRTQRAITYDLRQPWAYPSQTHDRRTSSLG